MSNMIFIIIIDVMDRGKNLSNGPVTHFNFALGYINRRL
ncbi:MAG: hypothetical protein OFPI_44280 [Osedax symbiont Rs2]|nr:MAG: hypothetical protein OFPI_44280 [Osedax symbiont Rs2]